MRLFGRYTDRAKPRLRNQSRENDVSVEGKISGDRVRFPIQAKFLLREMFYKEAPQLCGI
jgi:hypothetical protein